MNIAQNIGDLVGKTPIIKLNNIDKELFANIYAKCEFMNPTHSVKDRVAMNMLQKAFEDKTIDKNTHIIEPTSGNTGISLASQCASLGLKLTLVMPESMSIERIKLMKFFGANVVLTDAKSGMNGSIKKAYELNEKYQNAIVLQQFENKSNPQIHKSTTAVEMLNDMKDIPIDIFVNVVGTGGTLSGVGEVLKSHNNKIQIVAVEPSKSAVLSGKEANSHNIQGIGAGFIPKTLNTSIYDNIITINDEDAINCAKELATKEGLLVGISSGANILACIELAQMPQNKNKNIITVLCDTAQRYISAGLFC